MMCVRYMHSFKYMRKLLIAVTLLCFARTTAAESPASASQSTCSSNNLLHSEDSALNELKETIRWQAAEIERLKACHQPPQPQHHPLIEEEPRRVVASCHSGHGGAASSETELATYIQRPFFALAYQRVGWLSVFLLSLSFTALIMGGFEHTLERQLELSYFVPLLIGHAGNTGGQTVGTVLSAFSAGYVSLKDTAKVIAKESLSGLFVGLGLGALVGLLSHYMMGISAHVSTVVFFTLPLVSAIASFLGSGIPCLCVALGLDPNVVAAPAMTSLVDVGGLVVYFLIANQVFAAFGLEI